MSNSSAAKDQEQQGKIQTVLVVVFLLFLALGLSFFILKKNRPQNSVPETASTKQVVLPEKDVAGEDLEFIDRYPHSVRVDYAKTDTQTTNTYKAEAQIDTIKEYYLENLKELGWEVASSEDDQIKLEKEPATIFVTFYDKGQVTEYEVQYFPQSQY